MLELDAGRSTYFPGQWHVWRREKAARAARRDEVDRPLQRRHRAAPALRRPVPLQEVEGQAGAGEAHPHRAAEGGEGGCLRRAGAADPAQQAARIRVPEPAAQRPKMVVEVEGLSLARGRPSSCWTASRSRSTAASTSRWSGRTARGKTTLLETLLGRREQSAGTVRLGHGVVAAYFSQHEAELDERGSVLECVQSMTGLRRPEAQNLLGRFLFSGWETHEKPVRVLSGGERRRLALAVVVASGSNFLVLDEPTNHLDLESREALEAALENFPATVLLVSHDRALLDAVAERTLAIEDGTIRSYDGGLGGLRPHESPVDKEFQCCPTPGLRDWVENVTKEATAGEDTAETAQRARAGRGKDLEAGGDRRRPGAAARRRLGRHRAAHRPPGGAGRAAVAARPLGDALRAGAGLIGRECADERDARLPPLDRAAAGRPERAARLRRSASRTVPSTASRSRAPRGRAASTPCSRRPSGSTSASTASRRGAASSCTPTRSSTRWPARPLRPASRSRCSRGRTPPGTPRPRPARPPAASFAPTARGQEQVVACLDDARRAADHGFRSVLIADVGVLSAFAARRAAPACSRRTCRRRSR